MEQRLFDIDVSILCDILKRKSLEEMWSELFEELNINTDT